MVYNISNMPDQNYCETCKLEKTKRCNKCDVRKVVSEFDKNRKICKDCRRAYNSKYYKTQKDIKSVEKLKNI